MGENNLDIIYNNKEDIQNCVNYKGITFMSHVIKLWIRVIEKWTLRNKFEFLIINLVYT